MSNGDCENIFSCLWFSWWEIPLSTLQASSLVIHSVFIDRESDLCTDTTLTLLLPPGSWLVHTECRLWMMLLFHIACLIWSYIHLSFWSRDSWGWRPVRLRYIKGWSLQLYLAVKSIFWASYLFFVLMLRYWVRKRFEKYMILKLTSMGSPSGLCSGWRTLCEDSLLLDLKNKERKKDFFQTCCSLF